MDFNNENIVENTTYTQTNNMTQRKENEFSQSIKNYTPLSISLVQGFDNNHYVLS